MSKRGNFVLNEVPVSKILVFRRENDPSYSFIIIVIYLLEVGGFFFLVDALDSWFWSGGEDRTVGAIVSSLLAVEAKAFFKANLLFLWSELPDAYDIYVHSIWVFGLPSGSRGEIRAYGRRGGFVVFGLSRHNLVEPIPLGLKPFCLSVPFIDGGGYRVHRVNTMHECWVKSLGKEGDEGLVNYPTEVGSNFEFIDIGEDFILGLGNGLEVGKGFCLEVSG